MLNEALEKHRQGDLEAAERLYRELLDQDDSQADVHHFFGLLQQDRGDLNEALNHVERAIGLDDQNPHFFLSLAGVQHARGDVAGAAANAARAVELDPNLPEGHNTLGFLQFAQGDLQAAEETLRLANRVQPDSPGVLTNLGNVLLATGRVEDARGRFEQALALRPDDIAAQLGLGNSFLAAGAASFARACFERCLEAQPNNLTIRGHLATALLADGRADDAEAQFRAVLDASPGDFGALVGLADVAFARAMPSAAARGYAQALGQERGHVPTVVKLGNALVASHDYAAAARCFDRLVEQGVNSAEIQVGLARALTGLGERERAAMVLDGLAASGATPLEAALVRADLAALDDDHEQALTALRELSSEAREAAQVRVALARHGILAGHPRDALADLGEVPAGNPFRLEALELTGRAQDETADHTAAAASFAQLAAEAETPPPALKLLDLPTESVAAWPRESIDDGRGEPMFLLGLPGSGVAALAAALATCGAIDVLTDRGLPDSLRNDFLTQLPDAAALAALDEDAIRRGRRRYWNGVRHARTKLKPGVAGVDLLPPDQCDPYVIARYFPQATLLVAVRDPADHLLHTESFGWRDGSAPTELDLEAFYGRLADAAANTAVKVVPVDFDALRRGDLGPLAQAFVDLGIRMPGFEDAFQQELFLPSGLHRYWAAGHGAHYAEALGLDARGLDALRRTIGDLANA